MAFTPTVSSSKPVDGCLGRSFGKARLGCLEELEAVLVTDGNWEFECFFCVLYVFRI